MDITPLACRGKAEMAADEVRRTGQVLSRQLWRELRAAFRYEDEPVVELRTLEHSKRGLPASRTDVGTMTLPDSAPVLWTQPDRGLGPAGMSSGLDSE